MAKSTELDPLRAEYTVGYKKPPQSGKFTAGHKRSRGPRKRRPNIRKMVSDEIFQPIIYLENGKKVRACKLEVMLRQLTAKGLKGDSKAILSVMALGLRLIPPPEEEGESNELSDIERAVLKSALEMRDLLGSEDNVDG